MKISINKETSIEYVWKAIRILAASKGSQWNMCENDKASKTLVSILYTWPSAIKSGHCIFFLRFKVTFAKSYVLILLPEAEC